MWNLRGRSWWILNLMQCCSSSPSPWIQTYPPSKRASCVIQAYQKSSGRRAPPRLPMQHPLWKFEKRVEIQERITDDVHTKSEANNSLYRAFERIFVVIFFSVLVYREPYPCNAQMRKKTCKHPPFIFFSGAKRTFFLREEKRDRNFALPSMPWQ